MSKLTRLLLAALLAAMIPTGGTAVAEDRPTADAALKRVLAQEHSYTFAAPTAAATSPAHAAVPKGQTGRPAVALGVLAAALALAGTLMAQTRRHARSAARARQAT
jgi:hypothetical protein